MPKAELEGNVYGMELAPNMIASGYEYNAGGTMKRKYHFAELSKSEREYLEMVLLEEMDIQAWYCIAYSKLFDEELILTVQ